MSPSPDDSISTESSSSTDEPPTHEEFLDQLELLFGSRNPDFDRFGDLLHRRYRERKEAGDEEGADRIWKVHRMPLDVACEAARRWTGLDPDTKRAVFDLLQTYEQDLEEMQQTRKLSA